MFNNKRNKIAVDFTQPVNPKQIPGNTLEEKVAYITQFLDEKIAQDFEKNLISEEEVYQLITDRKIQSGEGYEFLEQVRLNIADLRKLAGKLIRAEGAIQPTDDVVDRIIEKLIERTGRKFIPQLKAIYRTTQRPEKVISPLLDYAKPDADPLEVVSIQNFIRNEVSARKQKIINDFEEINTAGRVFNKSFTTEHLIFMLENDLSAIAENNEIPLTPEQSSEIKNRLNILDRDVMLMNSNSRLWNRILEIHPDIPNKKEWSALIPENLRIKWSLPLILREADYDVTRTDENRRRITEDKITETRARSGDDSVYFYFFPDTDDLGNPLTQESQKRIYALSKLKESVENGYDNERIFDAIGVTMTLRKEQILKLREESESNEQETEQESDEIVYEETGSRVSTERDKSGQRINYWYKYQTKRDRAKGTAEAIESFRDDLREAGLYGVAKILGMYHQQPEDPRYEEWDLKFLSYEEMNICLKLREDFGLDPIPFPVKIPCPVDNPTTKDKFVIDFLLPCDVLVGFEQEESSEIVNQETGEIEVEIFRKPIIERKVIFIGEYFGWRHTMKKEISEWPDGREWCNPDGSLPVYRYESKNQTYIVAPGQECREVEFYDLKSKWKVFTTEVIGDILGTRTLSFNRDDLRAKKGRSIMIKLDKAKIIYHSSLCTDDFGCQALKEIKKHSTVTPEIQKYVDPNYAKRSFDDPKEKALRLVECAIANVMLVDVMNQAKRQFVPLESDDQKGKFYNFGGFNKVTLYAHQQNMTKIRTELDFLSESLNQKPIKKETYEETIKRRRATIEKIEQLESELFNLTTSPLFDFKQFVDSLLYESEDESEMYEPAIKIKKLKLLKEQIESGTVFSMLELKQAISEIDDSLIGQFSRDYLRDK